MSEIIVQSKHGSGKVSLYRVFSKVGFHNSKRIFNKTAMSFVIFIKSANCLAVIIIHDILISHAVVYQYHYHVLSRQFALLI